MLTGRVIRKAQKNASLTGKGRLIVEGESTVYDVEDGPGVRERLKAKKRRVLASVSWDGTVERERK